MSALRYAIEEIVREAIHYARDAQAVDPVGEAADEILRLIEGLPESEPAS